MTEGRSAKELSTQFGGEVAGFFEWVRGAVGQPT